MYHQHGLFLSSAGNMMYPQHGLHYYNPTSGFGWNMQPNYDMLRNSSGTVHSAPSIPPIAETGRSFTVFFTSEEEKNVLTRMIHMQMITDRHTKELNPSHVQLLNTMFANKKKRLNCFNDREKEREESKLRRAAGNVTTEVFVASDDEGASLDQPELGTLNSIAWSDLGESVKRRRLAAATKEMRDNFLPFLRQCIDALDEDGAPLGDDMVGVDRNGRWGAGSVGHLHTLLEAGVDEVVEVAVQHALGVADLVVGAQVLDARLVEHVGADLMPPGDVGLGIFLRLPLLVALHHFLFVHLRAQEFHGAVAVLVL